MNQSVQCPVCENEFQSQNIERLSHCPGCDHMFQTDLKISKEYNQKYIMDYFDHNSLRQMSLVRSAFVIGATSVANGKILDVGYGSGDFLRVMKKAGWRISGMDVHNLELGIPEIKEENLKNIKFDVVSFFDSLEHFDNFDILKEINTTWLVISIPHRPSSFPTNIGWKHHKPGEHLHYFSKESLKKLFSNYSLKTNTNIEDLIRGSMAGGENIMTYVFRRKYD